MAGDGFRAEKVGHGGGAESEGSATEELAAGEHEFVFASWRSSLSSEIA